MDLDVSHSQMEKHMRDFTKMTRNMGMEYSAGLALRLKGGMKDGGEKENRMDMDLS